MRLFHRKAGGCAVGSHGFYAEIWDYAFFHVRASCAVFPGCLFPVDGPAVDMGQIEGEGAAAEVGAVVVGRVPFAAEVAAVSGYVPFVPDGGPGGAVHDGHFRAEVGVSQGGEVEGNLSVVDPAANAPAGEWFSGGGRRDTQFA